MKRRRRLTIGAFALATPTFVATSVIAGTDGVHALYGVVLGLGLALSAGGAVGLARR